MFTKPDQLPRTISSAVVPHLALRDLWLGHSVMRCGDHSLGTTYGSAFGALPWALWITLTMGIMVGALALVFGSVFGQPIGEILPYIAVGLIFWGLFSSCITEGTTVFINGAGYIRSVPIPLSVHVFRMLARNLIIWLFNMAIYLVVVAVFAPPLNASVLLFVPAFALFVINVWWMALFAGILSTRFRDIPQLIANIIQVIFFLTPIFWTTDHLPTRPAFVDYNPLAHLIDLVRRPLLGSAPSAENWLVVGLMSICGTVAAVLLYRRSFSRIPYWV